MLAIIQARLSSARLPGKMLMDLCGQPMLGRVYERVRSARLLQRVVVATSSDSSDDAIAGFCAQQGIPCHRGPLDDVAQRFRLVARAEKVDAVVRISGDSPLMDPAVIDLAIGYFRHAECDLATNVLVRTFPKGQSVEVVRAATLERIGEQIVAPDHKEHVTKVFYDNPRAFRIVGFTSGSDAGAVNFSVDTREDFERARRLISAAPDAGWRELLKLHQAEGPRA
jgi:spore coat polysaccharide biosynthesis protein SpsF